MIAIPPAPRADKNNKGLKFFFIFVIIVSKIIEPVSLNKNHI